jgi:hypothetical protein
MPRPHSRAARCAAGAGGRPARQAKAAPSTGSERRPTSSASEPQRRATFNQLCSGRVGDRAGANCLGSSLMAAPRRGAANVAYHLARLGNRARSSGRRRSAQAALAALGRAGTRRCQIDAEPDRQRAGRPDAGELRFVLAEQAAWDRIEKARCAARGNSSTRLVLRYLAANAARPGALEQALKDSPPKLVRVCDLNVRLPHNDAGRGGGCADARSRSTR